MKTTVIVAVLIYYALMFKVQRAYRGDIMIKNVFKLADIKSIIPAIRQWLTRVINQIFAQYPCRTLKTAWI